MNSGSRLKIESSSAASNKKARPAALREGLFCKTGGLDYT